MGATAATWNVRSGDANDRCNKHFLDPGKSKKSKQRSRLCSVEVSLARARGAKQARRIFRFERPSLPGTCNHEARHARVQTVPGAH